jgi:hypothetical protein
VARALRLGHVESRPRRAQPIQRWPEQFRAFAEARRRIDHS